MKRRLLFLLLFVMVLNTSVVMNTCGNAMENQPGIVELFAKNRPELYDEINNILLNSDFTFVFFSDLHNGWRNLDKMIEFANTIKVNAVINAGDTVLKYLYDPDTDFSWYSSMVQRIDADYIPAVGNHDVWDDKYWGKAEASSTYDQIVIPAIRLLSNVFQPDEAKERGLCYYYCDYENVRIVVLNAMTGDPSVEFWDNEQKEWFENVLKDALLNNKQIICISHAPFRKDIALRNPELKWNSIFDYRRQDSYDNIHTNMEAVQIVQNYINDGGQFICWLSGHTHVDEVLEAKGYDDQIMFGIASARYSFHDDGVTTDDKEDPHILLRFSEQLVFLDTYRKPNNVKHFEART